MASDHLRRRGVVERARSSVWGKLRDRIHPVRADGAKGSVMASYPGPGSLLGPPVWGVSLGRREHRQTRALSNNDRAERLASSKRYLLLILRTDVRRSASLSIPSAARRVKWSRRG